MLPYHTIIQLLPQFTTTTRPRLLQYYLQVQLQVQVLEVQGTLRHSSSIFITTPPLTTNNAISSIITIARQQAPDISIHPKSQKVIISLYSNNPNRHQKSRRIVQQRPRFRRTSTRYQSPSQLTSQCRVYTRSSTGEEVVSWRKRWHGEGSYLVCESGGGGGFYES